MLYLALLVYVIDELVPVPVPQDGVEFRAHVWLSVALALAHAAILILTIRALAGPALSLAEKVGLFLGTGLFLGQIGNSTAHELIHSSRRGLTMLGRWLYISMLFGHHASSHRLVHHVHVATPKDPNSARLGESFYRFLPRAWIGSSARA